MNTKTHKPTLRAYQIFFMVLGAVCAAAIITNLLVRKVPVHDATIESDFASISGAIDSYVSSQSELPSGLSAVSGLSSATQKRLVNYEYVPMIGYSYQLCATFLGVGTATAKPYSVANATPDISRHAKGRECFQYTSQGFSNSPPVRAAPRPQ